MSKRCAHAWKSIPEGKAWRKQLQESMKGEQKCYPTGLHQRSHNQMVNMGPNQDRAAM